MQLIISLLALSGLGLAHFPSRRYKFVESYDHTNFFDKFRFIESNFTTGNYNDVDPTSGYINYRNREDAVKLGLIATQGTEIFLGVNHRDTFDPKGKGRDSVRIESNSRYNYGLFIAEFTHMPKAECGVWPAFWTYGDPWPVKGEMDIYENWNLAQANMITLHTGNASEVGSCTINQRDMLDPLITSNCDVTYQDAHQSSNQACATRETRGQWASASGGVYAMEWTSEFIKTWSWSRDRMPADVKHRRPKPHLWGKPHFAAMNGACDIDRHFRDQKLVINIDFCGVAAGQETLWGQQCKVKTGYDTCIEYVAKHPNDFADVFWQVKDISVYKAASNGTEGTKGSSIHGGVHLHGLRHHH